MPLEGAVPLTGSNDRARFPRARFPDDDPQACQAGPFRRFGFFSRPFRLGFFSRPFRRFGFFSRQLGGLAPCLLQGRFIDLSRVLGRACFHRRGRGWPLHAHLFELIDRGPLTAP